MERKTILLQQLEEIFRRSLIFGILFYFLVSGCNLQEQNTKQFESFINKFDLVDLPIDNSKLKENIKISENEFNTFLSSDTSFWKFKEDFYYYTSVYFIINNGITGIIYRRIFESESPVSEKYEYVLATFTKNGNLISSIVLDGINQQEDGETIFEGKINSTLEVSVRIKHFKVNSNGEESIIEENKKLKINKLTGLIE